MEKQKHLLLKEFAKKELQSQGYNKDEIFTEFSILIKGKKFIIDVVGINSNIGKIAIECGKLNTENRYAELLKYFDKIIHLPYLEYNSKTRMGKILFLRPTTKQYHRIQNILNQGRYKHLSEILRHCINIGLDELERKKQ